MCGFGDREGAAGLAGYSGCDIDYFPVLASSDFNHRPFWFAPPGHGPTDDHAAQINARIIRPYPDKVLSKVSPLSTTLPMQPSNKVLLEVLKREVGNLLLPAQKRLLLGLCLLNTGRPRRAVDILNALLADGLLSAGDEARARLTLARAQDSFSDYESSVESAKDALTAVQASVRNGDIGEVESRSLDIRARYQAEMARQQAIGPNIDFHNCSMNWRPGQIALAKALIRGVAVQAQLAQSMKKLPKYGSTRSVDVLRARHAVHDYRLLMLARIGRALASFGLMKFPWVHGFIDAKLERTGIAAKEDGDYFTYVGTEKERLRLNRSRKDAANELYLLLRDPLNVGIILRDRAAKRLVEGDIRGACDDLRAMQAAARSCESAANELKALVGLSACAPLSSEDRRRLEALRDEVTGFGYRQFFKERVFANQNRANGNDAR